MINFYHDFYYKEKIWVVLSKIHSVDSYLKMKVDTRGLNIIMGLVTIKTHAALNILCHR